MNARKRWVFRIEWKPQDCWFGVFWRRGYRRYDFWVCLLPMFPLHFGYRPDCETCGNTGEIPAEQPDFYDMQFCPQCGGESS